MVNRCLAAGPSTLIKRSGRPSILTTPSRRQLVNHATSNAIQCRKPREQIAEELGFELCSRTIKTAFDREQYFRRVAAAKPLISDANKIKRIIFAEAGINRPDPEWDRFFWTDEMSVRCGGGSVYVTRMAGEKFHIYCLVPKFKKYSAGMFWGGISGLLKGSIIPFE